MFLSVLTNKGQAFVIEKEDHGARPLTYGKETCLIGQLSGNIYQCIYIGNSIE